MSSTHSHDLPSHAPTFTCVPLHPPRAQAATQALLAFPTPLPGLGTPGSMQPLLAWAHGLLWSPRLREADAGGRCTHVRLCVRARMPVCACATVAPACSEAAHPRSCFSSACVRCAQLCRSSATKQDDGVSGHAGRPTTMHARCPLPRMLALVVAKHCKGRQPAPHNPHCIGCAARCRAGARMLALVFAKHCKGLHWVISLHPSPTAQLQATAGGSCSGPQQATAGLGLAAGRAGPAGQAGTLAHGPLFTACHAFLSSALLLVEQQLQVRPPCVM